MVEAENKVTPFPSLMDQVYRSQAFAGRVKRYHTCPMIREQSIADHSHRVITLFIELFGLPRIEVLLYMLYHDFGELYSGDTPFRAKREQSDLKESVNKSEKIGLNNLNIVLPDLIGDEWLCFKVADMLEMFETAFIETTMGNKYAHLIMTNIENGVSLLTNSRPEIQKVALNWIYNNREIGILK